MMALISFTSVFFKRVVEFFGAFNRHSILKRLYNCKLDGWAGKLDRFELVSAKHEPFGLLYLLDYGIIGILKFK